MARLDVENAKLRGRGPQSLLVGVAAVFLLAVSRTAGAGAMDQTALEAARALLQPPPSSVVVAAPLTTDQTAPRGEELALRVASLVAGRIGSGARAHPQTAPLASARAVAGHASALVYVQAEVAGGDLRTTVDVYPSIANAWERIRNPLPSPTFHAFATAKIDAEVRSFLLPLVLEQASVHRVKLEEPRVLAAACGDVDGDGGNEIVLVSRDRVVMGRVRNARFAVERTVAWSDLAPRAPVPMREPLAGAVATLGAVVVGSTDRGSVSLTTDFIGRTPVSGLPAWGEKGIVCLAPEPARGDFEGVPFDCSKARSAEPKMTVPAARFDAFAAGPIADARGTSRGVVVVREPNGTLKLRVGDVSIRPPEGTFGAELAVGDLDLDGAPDIASSSDRPDDAVDVWSVSPDGSGLRQRLHISAPAGVRALATCPPEKGGEPALVAVVGDELWLVRAAVRGTL